MCDFVEQNDMLSPLQSGFRKNHSTITELIMVTDDNKAMDNSKLTLLSLLDLSKAFDYVHHELFLVKLSVIGFSPSFLN
jgi:hypothetical protein